jgi:CRISPR/Cas system-associated endonuclease Cas3-HD
MMEFTGSCYEITVLEDFCKYLLQKRQARLLHDSSEYMRKPDGGIDRAGNKFNVKQYEMKVKERDEHEEEKNYQIFVGKSFEAVDVNVRFWYDRRINKAGIKISRAGLNLILKSMTVIGLLRQLNMKVSKNGADEVDLDLVKDVLKEAIKHKAKMEPEINVLPE